MHQVVTPRGQGIYKKLVAKGLSPKVAMAMARRSQNAKPGVQFANDGLSDPAGAMIELAYAQAAQREAENAARPVRRRTGTGVTEDRLRAALDRVERGTYTPTQAQRNLGFDGDGGGGTYGAGCSCGATGDGGQTVSRYHLAGCESALSGDEQAEYRTVYDAISAEPFTDANSCTWGDQHGNEMTLTDHFEALTGQRVVRDPFGGLDRPELAMPQRGYNQSVRALAAELGLGDHRAAREEARDRAIERKVMNQSPHRYRNYGEAMDHGESMSERRERYREPEPVTGLAAALGLRPS